MVNLLKYILFSVTFLLLVPLDIDAEEITAVEYCPEEGYTKALRQTIILIDENVVAVQTGEDIPAINLELIRLITNFVDPEKAQRNNTFLPREYLKVYAIPRDGTGPRPIFIGCQPFYSEEETAEIIKAKSKWESMKDTYFGTGKIAKIQEYADTFRRNLQRVIKLLGKSREGSASQPVGTSFLESSLIVSLQSASRLVNLHDGIPRIVLLSDFASFRTVSTGNLVEARTMGLAMAEQANINFSRAELYAVEISDVAQDNRVREFAHSFFLGSEALLSGWSNRAISNVSPNPYQVAVFQGRIDYGTTKPPVRLRLAWNENGTLVNSWIAVSLERTYSTPMSGAVLCKSSDECVIQSDESGFAQVWSTDPDQEPEYDAKIPFSGLRHFEIEMTGEKTKGKIFDPIVHQIGDEGNENLPFDLTVSDKGIF